AATVAHSFPIYMHVLSLRSGLKSEVSDGSSAKAHSGPAKEETTKPHALHAGAD
ncbi:hypothetical protein BS50DRAFT_577814, partial [Corynespora cassiicola Philippines]